MTTGTDLALRTPITRFDFIGRLETMEASWLDGVTAATGLPAYHSSMHAHPATDASSGSAARAAMIEVLSSTLARNPEREAVCRVLLPDFVCFGYALPADCAAAIGAHAVTCPIAAQLPPEIGSTFSQRPKSRTVDGCEQTVYAGTRRPTSTSSPSCSARRLH